MGANEQSSKQRTIDGSAITNAERLLNTRGLISNKDFLQSLHKYTPRNFLGSDVSGQYNRIVSLPEKVIELVQYGTGMEEDSAFGTSPFGELY
jgi:hypothetical protein